jgi:PPOX class probable F420-dependent enzyme
VEEARGDAGLTLSESLARANNRFLDRLRHRKAFEAAGRAGTARDVSALEGHKYCHLTTFRRDGTPVPSPVWFGLGDGKLYLRSEAHVGKVKRVRNDPHVRVAPCSFRGKPLGPATEGTARVLSADEEARAEAAIGANYGAGRRVYEGMGGGLELVYLEVTPS